MSNLIEPRRTMNQRQVTQADIAKYAIYKRKLKECYADSLEILKTIKIRKLYILDGYKNFEDFCKAELGSYMAVYRQLEAGEIMKKFPEVKNQSAALEVAKLPEENQQEVVEKAGESGSVTAESVQKAALEVKLPTIYDESGLEVPSEIVKFWTRNAEVKRLINQLATVRKQMDEIAGQQQHTPKIADILYTYVDAKQFISRLNGLVQDLKCALSDYVCPDCNGIMIADCKTCRGRGSLPEFYWNLVPEEKKQLRELAVKQQQEKGN